MNSGICFLITCARLTLFYLLTYLLIFNVDFCCFLSALSAPGTETVGRWERAAGETQRRTTSPVLSQETRRASLLPDHRLNNWNFILWILFFISFQQFVQYRLLWAWPWFTPHPTGHIGPHPDPIRVCQELQPLLPPRWTPSFVALPDYAPPPPVRFWSTWSSLVSWYLPTQCCAGSRRIKYYWCHIIQCVPQKHVTTCSTTTLTIGVRLQ